MTELFIIIDFRVFNLAIVKNNNLIVYKDIPRNTNAFNEIYSYVSSIHFEKVYIIIKTEPSKENNQYIVNHYGQFVSILDSELVGCIKTLSNSLNASDIEYIDAISLIDSYNNACILYESCSMIYSIYVSDVVEGFDLINPDDKSVIIHSKNKYGIDGIILPTKEEFCNVKAITDSQAIAFYFFDLAINNSNSRHINMEKQSPVIFHKKDSLDLYVDEKSDEDQQDVSYKDDETNDLEVRKTHTVKHAKVSILFILCFILALLSIGVKFYFDKKQNDINAYASDLYLSYKDMTVSLNEVKTLSTTESYETNSLNNIKDILELKKASSINMIYTQQKVIIYCRFRNKEGLNSFCKNIASLYNVAYKFTNNETSDLGDLLDNSEIYQLYTNFLNVKSKNKLFLVLEV